MTNSNDCYCITLRTAARKVSEIYNESLKPLGINVAQFSMLKRIKRYPELSITKVGQICELDRSTAGRNLKVLEKMELVQFNSSKDQREMLVSLTEKGNDVVEKGNIYWDQVQKNMVDQLGGEENAKNLIDLLHKI